MPDLQHLHHHWHRTWNELQHTPPLGLYEQLLQAYSEPQRHNHTLQHLTECLQLCSDSAYLAQNAGEVAIALWLHDAVYDVHAHGNEAGRAWRSACGKSAGKAASCTVYAPACDCSTTARAACL